MDFSTPKMLNPAVFYFAMVWDRSHLRPYNGKEEVEGTGLYAYGFRFYDPVIGRFTGVDPIADEFAFVSPFNYAENSPVRYIDLHGLQKTMRDVTWNDPGILAATRGKSFEEFKAIRDEYAGHLEGYGKAAFLGISGGAALGYKSGLEWMIYFASSPTAAGSVGAFLWGLGTDQDAPGVGDDFGRLGRRALGRSIDEVSLLLKPYNASDKITLFRGTKGGEESINQIWLTPDIDYAKAYVREGGEVLSYQRFSI